MEYDKRKLHSEITETLVKSHYRFIFFDDLVNLTATEVEGVNKKAIDYYLGITKDPLDMTPLENRRPSQSLISFPVWRSRSQTLRATTGQGLRTLLES